MLKEQLDFLYAQKDHLTVTTKDGMSISGKEFFDGIESGKVKIGRYRVKRETKSNRMQLLIRPYVKTAIKKEAELQGISMNELANRIFEDYLNRKERK